MNNNNNAGGALAKEPRPTAVQSPMGPPPRLLWPTPVFDDSSTNQFRARSALWKYGTIIKDVLTKHGRIGDEGGHFAGTGVLVYLNQSLPGIYFSFYG